MVRAFRPLIRRTAALALLLVFASTAPAGAMTGARNGALPDPLPLFPADNWWNLDIGNWPVDPNSSKYISFINNGGTRRAESGRKESFYRLCDRRRRSHNR